MNEEEEQREMPMPEVQDGYDERSVPKEYERTPGDILKENEVNIRVLDSGVLIRVGCKSIAFNSLEDALVHVNLYFKDPVTSYKKWTKLFIK
jgi:hypothetical protein